MTDMPDLARCPSCSGYFDADDMTGGECPNCAGPEPVDPWEFTTALVTTTSDAAQGYLRQRDQARRFAAAWQGEAEAYRQVVEALTHEFEDPGDLPSMRCVAVDPRIGRMCGTEQEHPVHRTVAVIQAELQPEEIRDAPDFDSGQVPASTGEQQR